MRILLIGAASALLLAGAAVAQPSAPGDSPEATAPPPADAAATPAPSDTASSAPVTGYNYNANSGAPATDLTTAKAGDPGIVSNGPVPDTPENRAKYGKPDSSAGQRTRAKGN